MMDSEIAVEMVDENAICVAAILGSTLNEEFEDVKLLNDLLLEKNKQTGHSTHFYQHLVHFFENFKIFHVNMLCFFSHVDGIPQFMLMQSVEDSYHHSHKPGTGVELPSSIIEEH